MKPISNTTFLVSLKMKKFNFLIFPLATELEFCIKNIGR